MATKISAQAVADTLANCEFDLNFTAKTLEVELSDLITYVGSPDFLPSLSEMVISGKAVAKITLLNLMTGKNVSDTVKHSSTKLYLESFDETVENVKTIKIENLSGDELADYYADLMK